MFEIEVVRFDAQDVIATSFCEDKAAHVYVKNGEPTFYTLNKQGKWVTFEATNQNAYTAAALSADGWYQKINDKWAFKDDGSFDGACAGPDLTIGQ